MTGYGQAEDEVNDMCYSVEIKTVNNRYLKVNIRLPETAVFLEDDIEKLLRQNLSRGTINYVLRYKQISANALFDIDEKILQSVMERLNQLKSSAGMGTSWRIDISNLLNLPGIIRPALPDKDKLEQIKDTVLSISQQAIDNLKEMRAVEGRFLETDLEDHCKAMRQDLEQIRARCTVVLQEYAKKLKKRVEELLAEAKLKLDGETLAREVAILAERSDISEEIARLDSHLLRFAESCQARDQAGRRLDFISQEMLREANTIASKASDAEIIHYVIDIKCRIDRIKEQVQNVE
jgi:uncharacterized protein (TIGR00255 family)